MNQILVSDVMTRRLVTAPSNASLLDSAKKIVRKKVGGLIITEGKKFKGFISSQDILWAIVKNPKTDLSKIKALDISPRKVITISSSAPIQKAIDKIKKFKFYRLPVVDKGNAVGMITVKDILSFYPAAQSELGDLELIREESEKLSRLKIESKSEGVCEECGTSGPLYETNGILMCEFCANLV